MTQPATSATFTTELYAVGNNVGIVVPPEVVESFGRGKRVPVVVTIDGGYSYANTISSMGGRFLISFNSETRRATGRVGGDTVEVRLDLDDVPRTAEAPAALAGRFTDADAAAWTRLAPSKQRAHAASVADAKTDETRERRIEKILGELRG
ncbi:YdeI/OmpD-associated family protein [Galbitalea sp. SE-J8]|uniref:YdeI/OmpD-associated family protein n=1 Tax=Galbitalea sp. SE-J8 TaxID=3054952 RepID=UPI00259CF5D9|nr:YdeI/OmpD-associated family protein [Galbitalea sp. SE-J8]MDM4764262.1 YdeI/OmpD-associated family protein [Galbitalea sp. SE-J8]